MRRDQDGIANFRFLKARAGVAIRTPRSTRDNAAMPRLGLFPFRYRDPRTGKWKRARYVAERHIIAKR